MDHKDPHQPLVTLTFDQVVDILYAEIHQCNMLKIISTKQSYSCGSSGVGLFVIGPYQLRCGSLVCIWSLNGLFYFTSGLHKSECLHP